MFTDTDVMMKFAYDRNLAAYAGAAQEIVDEKDSEIARLQRQLAASQRQNGDLVLDRGRARNEVLAKRLARQ